MKSESLVEQSKREAAARKKKKNKSITCDTIGIFFKIKNDKSYSNRIFQKLSEKIKNEKNVSRQKKILSHTKSMTFYECNAAKKSTYLQLVFKTE